MYILGIVFNKYFLYRSMLDYYALSNNKYIIAISINLDIYNFDRCCECYLKYNKQLQLFAFYISVFSWSYHSLTLLW